MPISGTGWGLRWTCPPGMQCWLRHCVIWVQSRNRAPTFKCPSSVAPNDQQVGLALIVRFLRSASATYSSCLCPHFHWPSLWMGPPSTPPPPPPGHPA